MGTQTANKEELKNWIDSLDNEITLLLLQSLKNSPTLEDWFWDDISAEQKQHIINALKKAKNSDKHTQKELWNEIERQYICAKDHNISEDQLKGIKRRIDKYERGESKGTSWEEIKRRTEKLLNAKI